MSFALEQWRMSRDKAELIVQTMCREEHRQDKHQQQPLAISIDVCTVLGQMSIRCTCRFRGRDIRKKVVVIVRCGAASKSRVVVKDGKSDRIASAARVLH